MWNKLHILREPYLNQRIMDSIDWLALMKKRLPVFLFFGLLAPGLLAQQMIDPPKPVLPVPTEEQLAWHDMELNAFVHFTTNTFTDLEWGFGDEPESVFNPSQANPYQWAEVLRDAGFQGAILTCKHHDGFCLWPSKYTDHSIKNSPYKNGQGDIVREFSDACKENQLKFGVYLSPWDRNHADYANPAYIAYYRNQLTEIFESYGPIFEMWFDGANGGTGYYGGAREKRSINGQRYYDWPTTIELVRKMEPKAIFFSDAGPGVRWCGNENGEVNTTCWNLINTDSIYPGKTGICDLLGTGMEAGKSWIPAEADVSIRPGWFYHPKEDSLVKTPEQLFDIYLKTVGRGSLMLLNIPPDRRGLIHEKDIASLQGFRKLLDTEFADNLAINADISCSSFRGNHHLYHASNLNDENPESYWATDDSVRTASIEINLKQESLVKYIVLQEYIRLGQRVKSFSLDVWINDEWKRIASETTIGHKRILKISAVKTSKIKINITDSRACPVISEIKLF